MTHEEKERDPQTYAIIGTAMEVHSELGQGFLEAVYQDAFEKELTARNIPFVREQPIEIYYKGQPLSTRYRADFVGYQSILIEMKAIKKLTEIEDAQILHYLKATRFERGLLLNFGSTKLEYKRFVYTSPR